jgi:hypothetical protein
VGVPGNRFSQLGAARPTAAIPSFDGPCSAGDVSCETPLPVLGKILSVGVLRNEFDTEVPGAGRVGTSPIAPPLPCRLTSADSSDGCQFDDVRVAKKGTGRTRWAQSRNTCYVSARRRLQILTPCPFALLHLLTSRATHLPERLSLSRFFARTQWQNILPNELDCTRAGRPCHNSGAVALLVVPPVHRYRDPRTCARIVPASESDASPPAVEKMQGPKRPPLLSLSILHPLAASAALPAPADDRAVVKFPPASLHTWNFVTSCLSACSSRAAGLMSYRRTGRNRTGQNRTGRPAAHAVELLCSRTAPGGLRALNFGHRAVAVR